MTEEYRVIPPQVVGIESGNVYNVTGQFRRRLASGGLGEMQYSVESEFPGAAIHHHNVDWPATKLLLEKGQKG
jgi:hypothetical protein